MDGSLGEPGNPLVLSNSGARLPCPRVSSQEFARKRKKERDDEKTAPSIALPPSSPLHAPFRRCGSLQGGI